MARRLFENLIEVEIIDMTGETHIFMARIPGSKDIAKFEADQWRGKGRNMKPNFHAARLKGGANCLDSIVSCALDISPRGSDEPILLSSTPGDPGYREDWKRLLHAHAPDIVAAVGSFLFERNQADKQAEEFFDNMFSYDEEKGGDNAEISGDPTENQRTKIG